jgi:hypothetical protein
MCLDISETPTLVAILKTEVLEALAKLAAVLYRANTVIRGLVVERPVCQEYTGIHVAALVDVIAVLWLDVRVDDVLESRRCVRIICCRRLSWFCILNRGRSISFWTVCQDRDEHTKPNALKPPQYSVLSPAQTMFGSSHRRLDSVATCRDLLSKSLPQ